MALQVQLYILLLLLWCTGIVRSGQASAPPCYNAIFVFGDSLSDTGNGNLTGSFTSRRTAQRPYGETFPGSPAGRFCDGRLLVDYLADFTGLPFLNPSQKHSADFRNGVNYAIAGATALDAAVLNSRRIFARSQNSALNVQIQRHLVLKAAALGRHSHRGGEAGSLLPNLRAFDDGLYVIAIGGNDYLDSLRRARIFPPSTVNKDLLPLIIASIRNATEVLYANGARHFLLFNVPPIGCAPTLLASMAMPAKDSYGCLRDINTLSYNHGVELRATVESLRVKYPQAKFILADFYGAFIEVLKNKASYGLTNTLDACCGAGAFAPYGFNFLLFCNRFASTTLSTLCPNPNSYISWDGIHFTDKFNSDIFKLTISTGSYLNPSNAFSHCEGY